MRSTVRRYQPPVIERLLKEPQRFGFFQAVRVLEQHYVRRGHPAASVVAEKLRFRNLLSLAFPPSEIAALDAFNKAGEKLAEFDSAEPGASTSAVEHIEITPAFFGLLGAQGALPHHFTEKIAEREIFGRDRAARAFLDIFTNRAAALFYAAWKKNRLAFQYETGREDHFLPLLLAFAGLGNGALRERLCGDEGEVHDEALAHYATAIRHRPLSADYLRRTLADYFRVPIEITPFVGRWFAVPPSQCSSLGGVNARLGTSALVGERVWQRDLRMRLRIGPLPRQLFRSFLPGGERAIALERFLALVSGGTLEFEIVAVLRKDDVNIMALGDESGARLGWDSFLVTEPCAVDRDDACYELQSIH